MRRDFADLTTKTFDLIVIGGGIMGSGVARDATLRGLDTLLLEKEDFAYGTTSRSSRLIHGGLRYLRQLEFRLVRQDMREREVLLHIAPHLLHPLPFLLPIIGTLNRFALPIGMYLYDLLSFDKTLPSCQRISTREALELEPNLELKGMAGAYLYYDCQVPFTERLCLENALSAAENGATVLNHAKVTGLLRSGNGVSGVQLEDVLSGECYQATARTIVNATGHWIYDMREMLGAGSRPVIRRTKGIHLVTPQISNNAVVSFAHADGRLFFIIPWQRCSLIGTTDTDYDGDLDDIHADADDVAYLLAEARRIFPSLKGESILYTTAGLRVLINHASKSASGVSRAHKLVDHEQTDGIAGFISLLGGKITGYRAIAQETVDLVCQKLGLRSTCRTAEVTLPGAPNVTPEKIEQAAQQSGLPIETARHLASLYGSRFSEVLGLISSNPRGRQPLCIHCPDIISQVWHAVEKESALTVSDFLLRRSAVGLTPCQGLDAVERVAQEMGNLLGWSAAEQKRQVEKYQAWIARRSPQIPNVP